MRRYILDDRGEPAPEPDLLTWAIWFESADRRVAVTELRDGSTVSTVFLGLDGRHGGQGPPLLFETMIFGGQRSGFQERYATRAEALTGHRRAVSLVTS